MSHSRCWPPFSWSSRTTWGIGSRFRNCWRLTKTDVAVWIITFALTVFADLTAAVGVGMVCAALLFIKRVADTTTVSAVTDHYVQEGHLHSLQNQRIPAYLKIYRIHGPFLFGSTEKLRAVLHDIDALPPIIILRLRNMTALDATGLRAIEELAAALHASGRTLLLCGARHQPERVIARADFRRHIGGANICANVTEALERARQIHASGHGEPTRPAA